MSVTVVVGAQWGDEGKAKVIDLLARENSVVARYQGDTTLATRLLLVPRSMRCS